MSIKTNIKLKVAGMLAVLTFGFGIAGAVPATSYAAVDAKGEVCNAIGGGSCDGGANSLAKIVRTVINILSAIGGVIAIIMIVIGGIKYITSNGDANNTGSAKNTIIYALVGLVIIAFAQIIVQYVLGQTT